MSGKFDKSERDRLHREKVEREYLREWEEWAKKVWPEYYEKRELANQK